MEKIGLRQKLDKEIAAVIRRSGIDGRYASQQKKITYTDFLSDKMLMILLIKKGVPYSLFRLIQHGAPFSEADWASLLNLSTKSLQRYKQSARHFRPLQSEKIIEIAEVSSMGLDVFGNMEKFKRWLDTPSYALGNLKPFDLLTDSYGKEMVLAELTRINHGILA